jgi:translation initiation factor 2B subunit (eIF-2B alpha/beta/delta family)
MKNDKEQVNHPNITEEKIMNMKQSKVIDAWQLGFSLGNTVKYISRAGKKGKDKELEDLRKALWYLEHHIKTIEQKIKSESRD